MKMTFIQLLHANMDHDAASARDGKFGVLLF